MDKNNWSRTKVITEKGKENGRNVEKWQRERGWGELNVEDTKHWSKVHHPGKGKKKTRWREGR